MNISALFRVVVPGCRKHWEFWPVAVATLLVKAAAPAGAGEASSPFPSGGEPTALISGHFPDRVFEFVWRNWNAAPVARLAEILNATHDEVTALASSMGLPPPAGISPAMASRGYITLIRRNWHLLPYDQLLKLVEMTPERLAFTLREDDFLWVKLGQLKPKCEPLRYRVPSKQAWQRATEIRRVVREEFGQEILRGEQPRFDFVRQLSTAGPSASAPTDQDGSVALRLTYSYLAVYGDPLLQPELNPFPDGYLERLAAVGVNGVWLHVLLRDLAPGESVFPEFGSNHGKRLANLRALVARAKAKGVAIYLYLNEPRAMPAAFFKDRMAMAGVRKNDLTALCTSHAEVRQWMGDALAHIFKSVPDLGGVYAITASENLTNCASHGGWRECERCKGRSDVDIIAEVAALIEEGVHRGNPKAKVILSDWGWKSHGDAREIIVRLPASVWLTSVSEWGKIIERGGVRLEIDEYTLSATGPGPRASRHWEAARQRGLKTVAEIQFNNSSDLISLPYVPVLDIVAEHIVNLSTLGLNGMFIGWTMGGYPSPNFELARRLNHADPRDVPAVLDSLARDRFGPDGAAAARRAWALMSDAHREYPFTRNVVYKSPVHFGPANPLYAERTGFRATMLGFPYDDVKEWCSPYPPEVFAAQFERLAAGWRLGLEALQTAVERVPKEMRDGPEADLRYARAALLHFESAANQARFILARDGMAGSTRDSADEERRLRVEIRRCLEFEIALARQLFALARDDSRIGFEPSCHYLYLPLDLVEKVINCRWLESRFDN